MTQTAKVIATENGLATVEVVRHSACDGCHKAEEGGCAACSLLGGNNTMRTTARNPLGACPGDRVTVEASSRRTIGYAALVFLFPLLLAAAAYAVGNAVATEAIAVGAAFVAFVLAFLVVFFVSRIALRGRCDIEITAILDNGDPTEETH